VLGLGNAASIQHNQPLTNQRTALHTPYSATLSYSVPFAPMEIGALAGYDLLGFGQGG